MKRVMIYAYTNINLGDDLFIKILCERYPDVQFVLQSRRYKKMFRNINNLRYDGEECILIKGINVILRQIPNINIQIPRIKENRLLKKVDASVYIGGSIFIQNQRWQQKCYTLDVRIRKSKKFYIIGCNFGPYTSQKFYNQCKKTFNHVEDICFREQYSYNLFSDLEKTRYAADVVFSLKVSPIKIEKKQVVISVIDLSIREELKQYIEVYEEHIKELVCEFENKGYSTCLMGFCEAEGDKKAIDSILNKVQIKLSKRIKSYVYSGNIEEALNLIQESEIIVASRFHAMILGWVFGKKVYPIMYSNKSLNVIKDIGFDGVYTMIEGIHEIQSKKVVECLMQSKPIDVTEEIVSANLQFKILDKLLCEKGEGEKK